MKTLFCAGFIGLSLLAAACFSETNRPPTASADTNTNRAHSGISGAISNTAQAGASEATTNPPLEIVTLNGVKYEKCRITKVEPSAITVFHSRGIVRILFSDLPDEWRKKYDYDPEKAEAYEKQLADRLNRQWKASLEKEKQREVTQTTQPPAPKPAVPAVKSAPKILLKPKSLEDSAGGSKTLLKPKSAAKKALQPQDVPVPPVAF